MYPVGFELTISTDERQQTHALVSATIGISTFVITLTKYVELEIEIKINGF
jgi:translation elongation factor EF-1alpha